VTLQLRGVSWGRVNYRWGECEKRGQDHLHVVWQKGGKLRRDCVEPSPCGEYKKRIERMGTLRDLSIIYLYLMGAGHQ
jgi:hypothetical protein